MTCCFVGHRRVANKELVFQAVKRVVEALIVKKNVKSFHFGSRSEFDDICHAVVTELQSVYPDILRINYPCKSEYVVKKGEREELERKWSKILKKKIKLKDFEGEKIPESVYVAGKASYLARNEEMIDDSEYCVFFYEEEYTPKGNALRKTSGKSGTRIAYAYAARKKKNIINVAKEIAE